MPRGAALKKAANGKVRRSLAYKESANCADVEMGDSPLFFSG